jgi:hypothetical protein
MNPSIAWRVRVFRVVLRHTAVTLALLQLYQTFSFGTSIIAKRTLKPSKMLRSHEANLPCNAPPAKWENLPYKSIQKRVVFCSHRVRVFEWVTIRPRYIHQGFQRGDPFGEMMSGTQPIFVFEFFRKFLFRTQNSDFRFSHQTPFAPVRLRLRLRRDKSSLMARPLAGY